MSIQAVPLPSSNIFLCIVPQNIASDISLHISTNMNIIHTEPFIYLQIPSILSNLENIMLLANQPSSTFISLQLSYMNEYLSIRFRSFTTNAIIQSSCTRNANGFNCTIGRVPSKDTLLIDITCDSGNNYMENIGSISVVDSLEILSINSGIEYYESTGNLMTFITNNIYYFNDIQCMYYNSMKNTYIYTNVTINTNNYIHCQVPTLPVSYHEISVSVLQQGYLIFGPVALIIYENPIVISSTPSTVITGQLTEIHLNFKKHIIIHFILVNSVQICTMSII